jgi:cytochrome c oxidase subunit 1
MPRRTYRYDTGLGWDFLNQIETIGSFVIAFSVLLFIVNVLVSRRHGTVSGDDPWDARTLEWTIPSPPPMYNFAEIPQVEARDDFWHRKYTEDESGKPVPVVAGASVEEEHDDDHGDIHMPDPSYYPILGAAGMPLIGYGLVLHWAWALPGVLLLIAGLFGWSLEPVAEEEH